MLLNDFWFCFFSEIKEVKNFFGEIIIIIFRLLFLTQNINKKIMKIFSNKFFVCMFPFISNLEMIFLWTYELQFTLYHFKPCFAFFLTSSEKILVIVGSIKVFFEILVSFELFKISHTRSNFIFSLIKLYFLFRKFVFQSMFI